MDVNYYDQRIEGAIWLDFHDTVVFDYVDATDDDVDDDVMNQPLWSLERSLRARYDRAVYKWFKPSVAVGVKTN